MPHPFPYSDAEFGFCHEQANRVVDTLMPLQGTEEYEQKIKEHYLAVKEKLMFVHEVFSQAPSLIPSQDYIQVMKGLRTEIDYMENIFMPADDHSPTVLEAGFVIVSELAGHVAVFYRRALALRTIETAAAIGGLESKIAARR